MLFRIVFFPGLLWSKSATKFGLVLFNVKMTAADNIFTGEICRFWTPNDQGCLK